MSNLRQRRERTRPLRYISLAAIFLVLTGCNPAADTNEGVTRTSPVPKSKSNRVLVIGDSLTDGAKTAGMDGLIRSAGGGANTVTSKATWGHSTAQGTAELAKMNPKSYDLIVLALGSNDYYRSATQMTTSINGAMAKTGTTPVVWVNVDTRTKMNDDDGGATRFNAALNAAAGRYPNLTISDWNTWLDGRPNAAQYRAKDRVHYTSAGYRLRAAYMADISTGHSYVFKPAKTGNVQVKMTGCNAGKVQVRHPSKTGSNLVMATSWKNIGAVPAGQVTEIRMTSSGVACKATWAYRIN